MECGEQLAPLRAARARALQQSFGFRWVTWRWRWDSNPRWCYPHTLSRRAPLAARTRHRRRGYRTPRADDRADPSTTERIRNKIAETPITGVTRRTGQAARRTPRPARHPP